MESARRSEALGEEMELHLADKPAELPAGRTTPECARAEARRRFGNVGLKHEESREIWIRKYAKLTLAIARVMGAEGRTCGIDG